MPKKLPIKIKSKKKAKDQIKSGLKKTNRTNVSGDNKPQICLNTVTLTELAKILPRNVNMKRLHWRSEIFSKMKKLEVPVKFKNIGMHYSRERSRSVEVEGAFKDVSIQTAIARTKTIAKYYDLNWKDFKIKSIMLERGGAVAVFDYAVKEIRKVTDRRVKEKVLGLEAISRDPKMEAKAYEMIADLNPQKYICNYKIEEKKVVVCSSLGSIK